MPVKVSFMKFLCHTDVLLVSDPAPLSWSSFITYMHQACTAKGACGTLGLHEALTHEERLKPVNIGGVCPRDGPLLPGLSYAGRFIVGLKGAAGQCNGSAHIKGMLLCLCAPLLLDHCLDAVPEGLESGSYGLDAIANCCCGSLGACLTSLLPEGEGLFSSLLMYPRQTCCLYTCLQFDHGLNEYWRRRLAGMGLPSRAAPAFRDAPAA